MPIYGVTTNVWRMPNANRESAMKPELARHVAHVAFRASANLNELLHLIRDHGTEEEYKKFLVAISQVSGDIAFKILKRIYDEHPEIESEIDERVSTYGVLISN
jgi:hypothetical protein